MEVFEVIMAGGGGTRFWPLSRIKKPKQLLNISGNDIMLNETILRMDGIVDRENVFIVTNREQKKLMEELLINGIPFKNILTEPVGRNTAPCILYAASMLQKQKGDGVMCVFPADHHIADRKEYQRIIKRAVKTAEETACIVTIGIKPTFPSTGYGYIKSSAQVSLEAKQVEKFVEKPSLETAKEYVSSGLYTWNSGVFIFKISTILEAFQRYLPDMKKQMELIIDAAGTDREYEVLESIYPKLQSISIDYGIMEVSDNVLVLEGDFGWSDVGSLDELRTFYSADEAENIKIGNTLVIDSNGCIVKSESKLLTLIGVQDLIVVESEDAVLVCNKQKAQDVKKAVEMLKEQGQLQYL